jgi:hypothetical protein
VDYIIATHAIWAAGGVVRLVLTFHTCVVKITNLYSTINHSSSVKEIAHAVKVIKPHFFIVDGIYQRKLREALNLAQHGEVTISTMVSRLDGHLLVRWIPYYVNPWLCPDHYSSPTTSSPGTQSAWSLKPTFWMGKMHEPDVRR